MRIKKGDTVKILYGKDSSKTGKVIKILRKQNMVVVDGLNMFKKHVKGDGREKSSEIVNIYKPLHMSKVMLVDPISGKATRVKFEVGKDKSKIRLSVKSGKSIDEIKDVSKDKKEKSKAKEETTKKSVEKKEKTLDKKKK